MVQHFYSTALTHYPKWRWKTKRSEYFPLPSMEWYWHPEPPTSATVFSALNIGSPAHIVQNVLSSPSTFLGLSRLPF
ncbi:hypothetical protein GYMLUDRAFT_39979 [Collybiopsis luxurians FD-317 M1]|nr:hypothetical protein GYMLUDRAFT_39979 [Collybiopsis luxurians FD-317 M1]